MKFITTAFLLLITPLLACSQDNAEGCKGDCCTKKSTDMKTGNQLLVCKLTTPEMQKRKTEVIASLKSNLISKEELPTGYRYLFPGTDILIDELASFIKSERLCCSFFSFKLLVEEETIWLYLTGPEGVKDFIRTELDF